MNRAALGIAAFATAVGAFVACSSSSGSGSGSGDDAGSPSSSGEAGSEAGADSGGSSGTTSDGGGGSPGASPEGGGSPDGGPQDSSAATPGDGAVSANLGIINVQGSIVSAEFFENRVTSDAGATYVPVVDAGQGSCGVTSTLFGAAAPPLTLVSAGTLSVTGASEPLTLTPLSVSAGDSGATLIEYSGGGAQVMFAPGAALTISGSGATVPAFSINVSVPGGIGVSQPDVSGGSIVVPRTADFPVAWTGGGVGTVTFGVSQIDGSTITLAGCTFPESAGSGVIPASVLGYLKLSSELDGGGILPQGDTLSVGTNSSAVITVGSWTIEALTSGSVLQNTVNVAVQ